MHRKLELPSDPVRNPGKMILRDDVGGHCSNWGIHGLWPEYTNGGYPSSCNSQAFSQSQVQDLVPRMNSEWQRCVRAAEFAGSGENFSQKS